MINKRTILVGPTASGKNYMRNKLSNKGFSFDVSYATRPMRKGEIDGIDYNFITDEEFDEKLNNGGLYEHVFYDGYKYGTGMKEWNEKDVFIMDPHGINCITNDDIKTCFIIYINPPTNCRIERMKIGRKWNKKQIDDRFKTDNLKFNNFKKYDIEIKTENF